MNTKFGFIIVLVLAIVFVAGCNTDGGSSAEPSSTPDQSVNRVVQQSPAPQQTMPQNTQKPQAVWTEGTIKIDLASVQPPRSVMQGLGRCFYAGEQFALQYLVQKPSDWLGPNAIQLNYQIRPVEGDIIQVVGGLGDSQGYQVQPNPSLILTGPILVQFRDGVSDVMYGNDNVPMFAYTGMAQDQSGNLMYCFLFEEDDDYPVVLRQR